ncbi:MAG: PAS domain-containing protein [Bacteroidetes bacterium]|nr:MAG: PAS domain-containing protein [Bacteroidota bacterium]
MKAIHKYAVYLIVLHTVLAVLVYLYFSNKWVWIGMQLIFLLSLYLGLRFFYLVEKPYRHLITTLTDMDTRDFGAKLLPTSHPVLDRFIQQYNLLMDKLRVERLRLEGQGRFLEDLIFSSPVGLIVFDYDGIITELNPAAETMLGRKGIAIKGTRWTPEYLPIITENGRIAPQVVQWHGRRLKVSQSPFLHKGFQKNCLLLEDVTAEILQSEKEAYGKVIRMMSHEVNNTTGALNSILQSLQEVMAEYNNAEWQEVLSIAANRNASMAKFLEQFALVIRVYEPHKQPVSLKALISKTMLLWQPEAAKLGITLEVINSPDDDNLILVDPIQLEQVFTNIIKNAMDAIGHSGQIKAELHSRGKGIVIADNGSGLTEDAAAQVFTQPFYSTKERGQGIGLMIIRDVLQKHDARFTLQTNSDGWTRFEIWFP